MTSPDGTLQHADQEARTAAALYGVQPLLGRQATKNELHAQAGQAGILHLAAHGTYNPVAPLASSITLAPTITSTVRLEASEVYALDLHKADLVVLSACQTNLGDVSAGDEVVGLTRAFFFAGTPTVVSSLWSVDDEATELLMERFYTHLRDGMGKAAALRQAQIDVRAQNPAPYYWAGFVLAGDADAIPTSLAWWWFAAGGVALVGLLGVATLLLVRRRRRARVPPPTLVPGRTMDQAEPLAPADDLLASLLATAPAARPERSVSLAPAPDHEGQASKTS